ncbi:hypothetical protein [Sulfobacillus harzensis]|uniref:Uncharacterized protein n=1 Tax=Sulfobacillus harzensis TaxID=2729629 RepID=A0A7Y0L8A2_9FIRM|nr:hypothetical protein [Sulfobacillus harzensis]NMP24817.1 hypothetical protein [Sulfobacillus harzensis]
MQTPSGDDAIHLSSIIYQKEREKEARARDWGQAIPPPTAELLSRLDARENHRRILLTETDDLVKWHQHGMEWAVIDRGLTISLERDKPFAYALSTLRDWFGSGKHTMAHFLGTPGAPAPVGATPKPAATAPKTLEELQREGGLAH